MRKFIRLVYPTRGRIILDLVCAFISGLILFAVFHKKK